MKKNLFFPVLFPAFLMVLGGIFAVALLVQSPKSALSSSQPFSYSLPAQTSPPLAQYPADYTNLLLPPTTPSWESALPKKAIPKSSPTLLAQGKKLYRQKCASCHGEDGKANGPVAGYLITAPANFSQGLYKFQSTSGSMPSDKDLFRSITAGFPRWGMPSFAFLSEGDRASLVIYLKSLSPLFQNFSGGETIEMGESLRASPEVIQQGRAVYEKLKCFDCHGLSGKGNGLLAATLKDSMGKRIRPAAFALGSSQFKMGSQAGIIYRTILRGIGPSGMSSYKAYLNKGYTTRDFQALATYVADLARKGDQAVREGWNRFVATWSAQYPKEGLTEKYPSRYSPKLSAKYAEVDPQLAREKGCLSCHRNLHIIEGDTKKMGQAILAMAGGEKGRTCVVCHQGNPAGHTKKMAHKDLLPEPGSMWVVSFGKGCGLCHIGHNGLSSLQDTPFPEVMKGPMMVTSKLFDPSGDTGHSHVYRMQRAMMSLEFGKASYSLQIANYLGERDFIYADFAMGDPLGPVPLAGSPTYKNWIAQALKRKEIQRIARTKSFPLYYNLPPKWKSKMQRYMVDYYRKSCGRCHVWQPGRFLDGEYRGSGCSACHVPYARKGRYEGSDPTIPTDKGGHPVRHVITAKVSYTQCSRCHMSLYKHENIPQSVKCLTGYGPEIHLDRGMECMDCHTSIDMHGDGNIYPSLQFQVEIRCSDCHGTRTLFPWELPVGDYRIPGKARGVFRACKKCQSPLKGDFCPKCQKNLTSSEEVEYIFTSRSNVKNNVVRRGKTLYLKGKGDGKWRKVPLLKGSQLSLFQRVSKKLKPYHSKPDMLSKHKNLECSACHSRQTSKCYICHLFRDEKKPSIDYLLSPTRFDPKKGKLVEYYKTKGSFKPAEVPKVKGSPFWGLGFPDILRTLRGTYRPFQPVCFTYVVLKKTVRGVGDTPPFERTIQKTYKINIGKTLLGTPNAHEFTNLPRNCQDCHLK